MKNEQWHWPSADAIMTGVVATLMTFIILATATYYIGGFSPIAAAYCLGIAVLSGVLLEAKRTPKIASPPNPPADHWPSIAGLGVVLADILLLFFYASARTGDPLHSPWERLPFAVFALFAAATFLALIAVRDMRPSLSAAVVAVHTFAALAILETVYVFGFGFDPFIHRTAEDVIAKAGIITPLQPYYVGQYVVVVSISWLTRLPIDIIDRWLVPMLAAILVPWAVRRGLAEGLGMDETDARFWGITVMLFPIAPLTFTAPNNFAILLAIVTVFLGLSRPRRTLATWAAIAAIAIHPLQGVPALAAAISGWFRGKFSLLAFFVPCSIAAFVLPAMFVLNNLQQHAGVPDFGSAFFHATRFLDLFRSPYSNIRAAWPWEALYGYGRLLPVILAAAVAFGAISLHKKKNLGGTASFFGAAAGVMIAIFFMSTSIFVPGVIGTEQLEFSYRLLVLVVWMLAPMAIYGTQIMLKRLHVHREHQLMVAAAIAAVIAIHWYFAYPQWNPKAQRAGYGVSRADFDAAEVVHEAANGKKYIALSDQILSVAALRRYGFESFAYPLPTGGELYKHFLLLYERGNRSVVDEAVKIHGGDVGFVALHDYDFGFDWLSSRLESQADRVWIVDGRILVFEFTQPRP